VQTQGLTSVPGMPSYCSDLNTCITSSSQTQLNMGVTARRMTSNLGLTRTSMYLGLHCIVSVVGGLFVLNVAVE
jgi:hypothetical protein